MPFDIHPLASNERERAYVLVHLAKPEVDLNRWRRFLQQVYGESVPDQQRGITVASMEERCLVGLYTWEVRPSLDHVTAFCVDNFFAMGALDSEPLFAAMIEDMEERASDLDCGAVQVLLPAIYTGPKQHGQLLERFRAGGFSVSDQTLRKFCLPVDRKQSASGCAPEEKSPSALH